MQAQIEIEYDQLVKLVKQLPEQQWEKLKSEVDKKEASTNKQADLLTLLLNGPVATKKQLETIKNNRKKINQWRTK